MSPRAVPPYLGASDLNHSQQIKEVNVVEIQGKSFNSSSDTQSDTSSDQERVPELNSTISPLLKVLKLDSFESFVIDSQGGLTGKTVLAQYPCILAGDKFFVWIGSTDISIFGKTTLMNLANLAEDKGASNLLLIIDKDHTQMHHYKRMFKVIDAERVPATSMQDLIKSDLTPETLDVALYKIAL